MLFARGRPGHTGSRGPSSAPHGTVYTPPENPGLIKSAHHCVHTGDLCIDHCFQTFKAGDTTLAECVRRVQALVASCTAPEAQVMDCISSYSAEQLKAPRVSRPTNVREENVRKKAQAKVVLEHRGRTYRWNGRRWFDAATNMSPPRTVAQELDKLAAPQFEKEDRGLGGFQGFLEGAKAARDAGQIQRAEKLVQRALALKPDHPGALVVYTSLLRRQGAPEKALQVSSAASHLGYAPLWVSRAGALCDLDRWAEAKKEVARALAQGTDKTAAYAVVNRIKAARPDLYEKS